MATVTPPYFFDEFLLPTRRKQPTPRERALGFTVKELRRHAEKAGLEVTVCEAVTREKRPPHFEVLTLLARKP